MCLDSQARESAAVEPARERSVVARADQHPLEVGRSISLHVIDERVMRARRPNPGMMQARAPLHRFEEPALVGGAPFPPGRRGYQPAGPVRHRQGSSCSLLHQQNRLAGVGKTPDVLAQQAVGELR